jgi:hypothetical protein
MKTVFLGDLGALAVQNHIHFVTDSKEISSIVDPGILAQNLRGGANEPA